MSKHHLIVGRVSPSGVTRQVMDAPANEDVGLRYANPTYAVGTSGRQRIQNDVLGRFLLALPDDGVASAFTEVVESIQKSIAGNHEAAQTLATLRDTLLPRLISGQLRLPEVIGRVSLQGVTRQIDANMSGYAALTRPTQGHEEADA